MATTIRRPPVLVGLTVTALLVQAAVPGTPAGGATALSALLLVLWAARIKIDRSFVATIEEPGRDHAIVGGLLELARTLRIETVAEGIEIEAQRDHLLEEHCRFGQGFLYARPLPAGEAESVLAATRVSPAAV